MNLSEKQTNKQTKNLSIVIATQIQQCVKRLIHNDQVGVIFHVEKTGLTFENQSMQPTTLLS